MYFSRAIQLELSAKTVQLYGKIVSQYLLQSTRRLPAIRVVSEMATSRHPTACSETSRRDLTAQPSLQIACSKLTTSASKKLNGVNHSVSLKDPASEFCLPEYVVVGASKRTLSGKTFGRL